MTDTPSIVPDVLTGEPRILATRRASRPHRPVSGCPFCPGNEEQTPAEISRVGTADGAWIARAIPNLYPLAAHHELIVMSPRHVELARELNSAEWAASAELLVQRYSVLPRDDRQVLIAFINDGEKAGASIPHAHLQLLGTEQTPRTRSWMDGAQSSQDCALCTATHAPELTIEAIDGVWIGAHPTPRAAGALLAAPLEHEPDVVTSGPAQLAAALAGLARYAPDADCNFLLYSQPSTGHWHAELLPRVGYLAGAELGLGVGVSLRDPVATAEAARNYPSHR